MIPPNFWTQTVVLNRERKALGTSFDTAMKKWNEGRFPMEPGEHPDLNIFDEPVLIDNGYNDVVPVELTVNLLVKQELYFGELPISKISGFKDELSGKVITNAFTVGILSPDEVERNWQRIASEAELPMPPVLKLIGMVGYGDPNH